ncbi:MAG TPA: hypothetical protein VJN18_07235 [Polyangiaceae bacterium]|nr:hypothetical protein [Polyangiaceae bacterium]
MIRLWQFIGGAASVCGLAACSSDPVDSDGAAGSSSGGEAASAGKAGSGTVPQTCPDGPGAASETEEVVVGRVEALIVDEQGDPTSPGLVQVCAKNVCYDVAVNGSGQMLKDVNGGMNAPACKLGDGRAWGKLAFPFGEGDTDLGTLVVVALPDYADGVPLVAGESATSAGVTLTLDASARVEIDTLSYEEASEWGFRAAVISGDALAQLGQDFAVAYALAPLETVICPSPALSIDNATGLAAGTELELFSQGLDVLEEWAPYAGWQKVGEGQVSEDGASLEFPDGLPVLTAIGVRERS